MMHVRAFTVKLIFHYCFPLLLQKSQVTSLFGADALWSKGYTGAKVKMAIFDTGIRANHPHFRNIKVNFMADRNIFVSVLFFFCLCLLVKFSIIRSAQIGPMKIH